MSVTLNRRAFALGAASLGAAGLLPSRAYAQGATRSVTTPLGTYDIPVAPKRVVAVDSRIDLQPALALGLPVVGYSHSVPGAWVPVSKDAEFVGAPANLEKIVALEPDLIICADYDRAGEWWPIDRLKTIAPVLPTPVDIPWKTSMKQVATWLGMDGALDKAVADYDAQVAAIKAKHGDKLANKTVVAVQPDTGALYPMTGSAMLQPQVLADLGAKTLPPAEGQLYDAGAVSSENFASVFGDIDGLLLVTLDPGDKDIIAGDPLWQRLPAVAAGAVVLSNGNVNYGSIYSAGYLAGLFDELYSKIA